MKKFLSLSVLALASLWLTPGASFAGGSFGLFTQTSCWPFNCLANCRCCGDKCCSTACTKPYNAFTPACSGSITFNGCCPFGLPQGPGYGPPPPPAYGPPPAPSFDAFQSASADCCDGAASQMLPTMTGPLGEPASASSPTPLYMAPAPTLVPPVSRQMYQNAPANYGPMQVGYNQATAPAYNPAYLYVQPMSVPYYWNSNGR